MRWIVTLLFLFSAGICVLAIANDARAVPNVISHALHGIMAVAMAVMAWPRGAELPNRAPMIFFAVAALWFAVLVMRTPGHRVANAYHTLMMLAMAWMYAAMGGLPSASVEEPASTAMAGMDMPAMPGMAGSSDHAGHGGHVGNAAAAPEASTWAGFLNWLCTTGFAAATVFWLYRLITARVQPSHGGSHHTVGILCQLAMAAGMAVMFAVML